MDIVIGKLAKHSFSSEAGDFHIYRARANGGKWFGAVYRGEDPPKALKTVEVVMFGEWSTHPKYGKQLEIARIERFNGQSQGEQSEVEARRAVAKLLDGSEDSAQWIRDRAKARADKYKKRYPGFSYGNEYVEWILSLPFRHQLGQLQQEDSIKEWNKSRRKGDAIYRQAEIEK